MHNGGDCQEDKRSRTCAYPLAAILSAFVPRRFWPGLLLRSAATETLYGLISGQALSCSVVDIDRYGRLVSQCFFSDGRDIAAEMIRSGAASEYCRYSRGFYGTC